MDTLLKTKIIDTLKQCYDPELPIDVWNLGLIYDISSENNSEGNTSDIKITMTLTTPGCGMARYIAQDVQTKIQRLEEVGHAEVEITFDPRWTPEMVTDEGKAKLGIK